MPPQSLDLLLSKLDRVVDAAPLRRDAAEKAGPAAARLAARMPLIHRTGQTGKPWTEIFSLGQLKADEVRSLEKQLGYERAVYFFLGCGAYPHGHVALVLPQSVAHSDNATFTPFDTGALTKKFLKPAVGKGDDWDGEDARRQVLADHLGSGRELGGFAGPYLAAHFRDPRDYVRGEQESVPDFDTYHGLMSENGDRRAWTIEVHVHDDVGVPADPSTIARLLLDDKDLRRDLPTAYVRMAKVARDEDDDDADFFKAISAEVLDMIEGSGA